VYILLLLFHVVIAYKQAYSDVASKNAKNRPNSRLISIFAVVLSENVFSFLQYLIPVNRSDASE